MVELVVDVGDRFSLGQGVSEGFTDWELGPARPISIDSSVSASEYAFVSSSSSTFCRSTVVKSSSSISEAIV